MALAPETLSANLGPGPRAFLQANPPSRGPVGSLPSPGLSQLQQWRAIRQMAQELSQKYAMPLPQVEQMLLRQLGVQGPSGPQPAPPDTGENVSPGGGTGVGGSGGLPTGYSNITGYDPSLVGMGAKFAGSLAPGGLPLSLALGALGAGLPALGGANLSADVQGYATPVGYVGPTSLMGSLNPFSGNFLSGAIPTAMGFGANAGLPGFVSSIPANAPTDPFGLANMAPQVGVKAESINIDPVTGLPAQVGYAVGPFGSTAPMAGSPFGGYGNPAQFGLANSPAQAPSPRASDPVDAPATGLGDTGFTSDPSEGSGSSAAGIGTAGVGSSATGVGSGEAVGVEGGPVGEAGIGGVVGDGVGVAGDSGDGGGGGGGGGGSTVICTELHRQGLMDDETWAADVWFGLGLSQETLAGYHLWAIPVAKAMRRSRLVTALVAPLALRWAREMAFQMNTKPTGSLVGRALMVVGVPICKWLGYNSRKGVVRV